jgi:hypothetical protein
MRRIISETAGAVTANDFYETPPQAAEDAA